MRSRRSEGCRGQRGGGSLTWVSAVAIGVPRMKGPCPRASRGPRPREGVEVAERTSPRDPRRSRGARRLAGRRAARRRGGMVLVGTPTSTDAETGGRGSPLSELPDGAQVLYLAHEAPHRCLSVIDVTRPEAPVWSHNCRRLPPVSRAATRWGSRAPSSRSPIRPRRRAASSPACGCSTSRFRSGERAHTLDDLRLVFFDTSGPESRGVHNLWFVDGQSRTSPRAWPTSVRPTRTGQSNLGDGGPQVFPPPREVGRWWLPGTDRAMRASPAACPRVTTRSTTATARTRIEIWPDRPDRAYVAYIDGGGMIFDVSGLAPVRDGKAPPTRRASWAAWSSTRPTPPGRTRSAGVRSPDGVGVGRGT